MFTCEYENLSEIIIIGLFKIFFLPLKCITMHIRASPMKVMRRTFTAALYKWLSLIHSMRSWSRIYFSVTFTVFIKKTLRRCINWRFFTELSRVKYNASLSFRNFSETMQRNFTLWGETHIFFLTCILWCLWIRNRRSFSKKYVVSSDDFNSKIQKSKSMRQNNDKLLQVKKFAGQESYRVLVFGVNLAKLL